MRAKTFTVVGSTGGPTYSPAYPVDTYPDHTSIGIGVIVSGVHTIADVQHTYADWGATNINVVSAVAWCSGAITSATQANNPNGLTTGSYDFPVRAIRLRVRAFSSASVGEGATITIQQAGS